MFLEPFTTLAIGTTIYAVSGPVRGVWLTFRRRRTRPAS